MKRFVLIFASLAFTAGFASADNGKALYLTHCASCHHAERYGLKAPALIPETLKGYKKDDIVKIVKNGLPATQMPSFREILSDGDIEKIVSHITAPIAHVMWAADDIAGSREGFSRTEKVGAKGVDYENITLVVESGKSVTVMDGQNFQLMDKFEVGAIHGGPKFSYSLRYVYAPTRDGVITKYDLASLAKLTSIKVGINTRNIAVSDDDRWIAAANYLPNNIVALDNELAVKKILEVEGKIGGMYTLTSYKKFICSFRDLPELWLIDYTKDFAVEKIALPEPFEDMSIAPFEDILIGASRKGTRLYLYSLKDRKVISSLETDGMPHLASATYWSDKGALYAAINHLKRPVITILDLNNKKIVKEIAINGTGFFVRTHQSTPFIWVDTNTDSIQIIDKATLQVIKTLIPSKDKKAMHIEFTKDGKYALVSIYEEEGAVIIYDAVTLNEIKRLPFKKPAGKYNALNKTYPGRMLSGHQATGVVSLSGH